MVQTEAVGTSQATVEAAGREGAIEIAIGLRQLLADVFALFLKTKNFHWHMSERQFSDYHLLLDEQAEQIFLMTDDIAERGRRIGGTTLRSISDVTRHQRLRDNNAESVTPKEMLNELRADNQNLACSLRLLQELCERRDDLASARLLDAWTEEAEARAWFLAEFARDM